MKQKEHQFFQFFLDVQLSLTLNALYHTTPHKL